jgi:hypothetical protein
MLNSKVRHILNSKIDVKGGKLTYGQRIELGKIFEKSTDEIFLFKGIFSVLHGYSPKIREFKKLLPYFESIIEGLEHWLEAEKALNYEPSTEEKQAGIIELGKKIGEFGTIKALAKNYGKEPDEILKWEYGKVFGILYTDLEEFKFQKRYNEVIERKYK